MNHVQCFRTRVGVVVKVVTGPHQTRYRKPPCFVFIPIDCVFIANQCLPYGVLTFHWTVSCNWLALFPFISHTLVPKIQYKYIGISIKRKNIYLNQSMLKNNII